MTESEIIFMICKKKKEITFRFHIFHICTKSIPILVQIAGADVRGGRGGGVGDYQNMICIIFCFVCSIFCC